MLIALIPIIQMLITAMGAGAPLMAALGGVGELSWLGLGDAVLSAAPEELKIVRTLHPIFAHIVNDVIKAGRGSAASPAVQSWLAANGDAAIRLQPGISSES